MTIKTASEHVDSWYAATRTEVSYPALEGQVNADVAVVGAGFTGVSAALFLAERGYDVVLVEASRIGWGASGRNGGQLIDGFVEPWRIGRRLGAAAEKLAWEMGLECREIVVSRIREYDIDCDLKLGYLDLALKQREVTAFREHIEAEREKGYPHEMTLIEARDLRGHIGSKRYVGGMHNAGNGHLHPLNLCIGECNAAAKLGARVFEQSPVTGIRHGKQPLVETTRGCVRAHKVILAGNAYLRDAEPGIRDRVIPAGSYIIATEPLDEALAAELLPSDSACCDQRAALDYFRLTPDRRLLFGGLCNYSGRKPRDIKASLQPKMEQVFPQLAGARVDFQWGGNIAISINRIPQFGRIQENTYYAQGYSGHGVAPTHLAGKMLADIVAGESEQFDLFARIRHMPIPGGHWFANPVLGLGMLYFRLRELL